MRNYLLFPLLIFVLFTACIKGGQINGHQVQGEFNKCDSFVDSLLSHSQYYYHQGGKVAIKIPANWDIQENDSDSLWGIFAMDTIAFDKSYKNFSSIMVAKHEPTGDLKVGFETYLKAMETEVGYHVREIGTCKVGNNPAYWMLADSFEEEFTFGNFCYYLETKNGNIYILQATVYLTDDYIQRLCNLIPILETFNVDFSLS